MTYCPNKKEALLHRSRYFQEIRTLFRFHKAEKVFVPKMYRRSKIIDMAKWIETVRGEVQLVF